MSRLHPGNRMIPMRSIPDTALQAAPHHRVISCPVGMKYNVSHYEILLALPRPDPRLQRQIPTLTSASNNPMTDTQTQTKTATDRLTDLQDHQQELLTALMEAQNQHQLTSRALSDTRNVVRGYERSTRPAEMAMRDEAQARLVRLQEQAQAESARIATLEGELNVAKARIAALFEGQDGYEVAVAIYREAKAHVAEAETALATHRTQQQTADDALAKAEQTNATAARDLENALDPASINRARGVLTKAQQAEADARTLVGNLQRHETKLTAECEAARLTTEQAKQRVFKVKAALLADECKQHLIGPALEAFAAARLAGSGWSFRAWLADTLDSRGEYLPTATEAHQAALVAELETATALEVTDA